MWGQENNMKNSISIESTGLIHESTNPELDSVEITFPSLVQLNKNELLATVDMKFESPPLNRKTVSMKSIDDGETWHLEKPILSQNIPLTTHSIRTSKISDGTLIGLGILDHIHDPEIGVLNQETFGRVPNEFFIVRSTNQGDSWSDPKYINPPLIGPSWEICHPILELNDGRWLLPTATWRGWNGDNPSGDQADVFISDDLGETWPSFGRSFDGRKTLLTYWEQSLIQLKDNRLLAVCWVYDMKTGTTYPNQYSISKNRGQDFCNPMDTGFHAQTCKVIQLQDEKLLCVYRRHDKPGLWASLSVLENDQWINLTQIPLWQGADSGMYGKSANVFGTLKFGYPSIQELPSGKVLLLFWCIEKDSTNVRWIKLNLD